MTDFERVKILRENPSLYYREILGATLEPYQSKALEIISRNSRTAISSCHNLGKSWIAARLVLHFGSCNPHSKIITTAPTYLQVRSILWAEIRTAHAESKIPLGGELNLTEWKLGSDWFALGFTPRNELTGGVGQGTASSFQGFHAKGGILVIFDEATGVPPNVWTMAEGLMTQANVKFVVIGNPTSRNSEFFRCFQSPEWAKVNLTCFDSPNLIANQISDLAALERELDLLRSMSDLEVQARIQNYKAPVPYLLSASWVMGRALKWGLKHPLFVSKVLGAFPEEGDDTLMPLGICEEAQRRYYLPEPHDRRSLGVDVARFGSDSSVLTYLHGNKFVSKRVLIKRDTTEVTGAVIDMVREHGGVDVIVIDETGIGSGVVDQLNEATKVFPPILPRGVEIRGVQFGAGCESDEDKAKYVNLKARMFDLLSHDLKTGLCLPDEDVYVDELPTILYSYDSKGRMQIESKDDYKKRTGRQSPDHADSLALANYGRHNVGRVGSFAKMNTESARPRASRLVY